MSLIIKDRVKDTTTTTGTGSVTVSGTAPTGFRTFNDAMASSDTSVITIHHQTADEWEICETTYSGSNVLTRGTLLDSSTGSRVSFSAGTKDVWIDLAAGKVVDLSRPQTLTNKTLSLDDNTVEYTPSGTSAVARSVSGKIGEIISVTDFGATGDGVTDDTVAIQAAIDAAPEGATVKFPTAHYCFTSLASDKALTLDFCGSDLTVSPGVASLSSAEPAIKFSGSLDTRHDINTPAVGDESVELASGTASDYFAVGDYVEFLDDYPTPGWDENTIITTTVSAGGSGYTNGEFVELVATSGSGTNACGTVAVTAGAVTAITLLSGGTAFAVSDTFNITPTKTGGTGATGSVASIDGGLSSTNPGRREINRVKSLSGSSIYLDMAVEWAYDSSYSATIAKINVINRPRVINVGTVTEVDPGGVYTGSSTGGPDIVFFQHCIDPILSGMTVDGWQMLICQFSICMNPLAENVTGSHAFRPASPGHGYVIQFIQCRRGLARKVVGTAARHVVDFSQCYDCTSQNNTGISPSAVCFPCHGLGARRCRSVDDTVYFSNSVTPFGWSCGNGSFYADYDYTVVRPVAFGDCNAAASSCVIFQATSGAERFKVIDPTVIVKNTNASAYTKVLQINGGAKDAVLDGGYIDISGVANGSVSDGVFYSQAAVSGSTAKVRPINATVKNSRIKTNETANGFCLIASDLAGYFRVKDVEIDSSVSSMTNIRVSPALEEIDISGVRHLNGGKYGVLVDRAPTRRYRVLDNYYQGSFSSGSESLATSTLLENANTRTWTPTVTSGTGALTTVGATSGSYTRVGNLVFFSFDVAITTNGTGATNISVSLPFTVAAIGGAYGKEINLTGKHVSGSMSATGTAAVLTYYDGTYPGATGCRFRCSGFYWA